MLKLPIIKIFNNKLNAGNRIFQAHSLSASPVSAALELLGTEAQRKKYLPGLYSGKLKAAVCSADAKCGTDPTLTEVEVDR